METLNLTWQADRQAARLTDRQADRQTGRQTGTQKHSSMRVCVCVCVCGRGSTYALHRKGFHGVIIPWSRSFLKFSELGAVVGEHVRRMTS